MNKRIFSVLAIGSLSTLCCAMFNSHMPDTNRIAREMHERTMRENEERRKQQQEEYWRQQRWAQHQAQLQAQQQAQQKK